MAFGSRFRWVSALFLCASVALAGCGGEEAPEPAAVSIDRSAEAATVNGQIIYVADVELEARMKGVIEEGEALEPSSVEFDEILDQLIEAAGQPFYEGLARLTKASLEGIQAELGLDVVYPRFYR